VPSILFASRPGNAQHAARPRNLVGRDRTAIFFACAIEILASNTAALRVRFQFFSCS
jgi:hypothetical protein